MAAGLRRYLDRKGEKGEGINFRAAMPVNLRPLVRLAELGNQFGLVFLSLPVGAATSMRAPVVHHPAYVAVARGAPVPDAQVRRGCWPICGTGSAAGRAQDRAGAGAARLARARA